MPRLRLVYWRRLRALSQRDLAAKSGVSRGAIAGLEAPDAPEPRPSTVRRLAEALGIDPAELWEEEDRR